MEALLELFLFRKISIQKKIHKKATAESPTHRDTPKKKVAGKERQRQTLIFVTSRLQR
jgi:hypothetical protein